MKVLPKVVQRVPLQSPQRSENRLSLVSLVLFGMPILSLSSSEGIHMNVSVCTFLDVRTYVFEKGVCVNQPAGMCVQFFLCIYCMC